MPPTRPTIPDTTPILVGKSSLMYLNVDAIPQAKDTPSTKSSIAKPQAGRPIWNVTGPRMVWMMKSVCG
jgi:hypothetical protein